MKGKATVCDECGRIAVTRGRNDTVHKWFRLTRIRMMFRHYDRYNIPNRHTISIRDDPDFCSKECLMKWFEDKVDSICHKKRK